MKLCPQCEEAFADDAGFCPFDGQRLARGADPLLGRTLAGRYRLVRRLGSGGMSLVYLARHVMIERRSAIKILRQDLGVNPAHRERFLREARAVNRINHPNIVEITDLGEDGNLVFLVMEYVEGELLSSAVQRGPLAHRRAARIGSQIASALARAHELGVIHRDLKPDNVLLALRDRAEVAKLTDFGIAKIVDAPSLTYSEQRFGTPGYIAPEYIEGQAVGPRGDLYALGVVLYQMLTGTLPFDARFPAELLALQIRGSPVDVRARAPGIGAALGTLVMDLLARRPEDRPRDAFAVLDRLRAAWTDLDGGTAAARGTESIGPPSAVCSAIPARWRATLAELELRVEDASHAWGDADPRVRRARDLVDAALDLHVPLDQAGAAAADRQVEVDHLQARAREMQARLGGAIDVLSRDRSRERARIDAAVAQRAALEKERFSEGSPAHQEQARSLRDLQAEVAAREAAASDLGYQVAVLQRQLQAHNEEAENAIEAATRRLDEALAEARRITVDMARARAEAMRTLEGSDAGTGPSG